LKAARLVDVEPRANQRLYGLRGDRLRDLNKWLENYRAIWEERMEQLDELVQELSGPFDSTQHGQSAQGPPFDSTAARTPSSGTAVKGRKRSRMPVAERSETMTQRRATVERVSDTELVWRHTLRAKAGVVFDAYTKPELVKRWWAPKSRGLEMVQCEADVRVGGAYVYALAREGKIVVTFTGRYLELDPPLRLVQTAAMAPFPEESRGDRDLHREGRRDRAGVAEVYPSKAVLDQAIASGMEDGCLGDAGSAGGVGGEPHEGGAEVRARTRGHTHRQRAAARRVRGVDQGGTVQEVVGAKVVWAHAAFLRNGRSRWGAVSPGVSHEGSTMEFFGTYLEVTPHSRLVWTNEEGDQGKTVTTVTFDEVGGKTLLVVHDLYPSKEALEAGSGSTEAMPEAFDQLEELLASLVSST
jgi:uncharacterized protein YndB with AHSA1/START domain